MGWGVRIGTRLRRGRDADDQKWVGKISKTYFKLLLTYRALKKKFKKSIGKYMLKFRGEGIATFEPCGGGKSPLGFGAWEKAA